MCRKEFDICNVTYILQLCYDCEACLDLVSVYYENIDGDEEFIGDFDLCCRSFDEITEDDLRLFLDDIGFHL